MYSRRAALVLLVFVFAACSSAIYTVGGTVTGLQGSGLVLQNDGTDDLEVSKDGPFTLPGPLAAKTPYFVTVLTQPSSPTQTCTVTSAAGAIVGANITNVAVNCSTSTYPVGGTVTGLAGTGLVLQDNGGDALSVTSGGSFSFATPLAGGAPYAVTIMAQPTTPTQTCTVTGGTGTVGTAPVTSVGVACTTSSFTIGGSIAGLMGTGLVLQDNGGDDLTVTSGESFVFATPLASGAPYSVTIKTQPANPAQVCSVSGGTGTVGSGNVMSVTVNCSTNSFTVGGVVTGLTGSGLTLEDNGGDKLSVTSNGLFAFPTPVASGAAYAVTVSAQPAMPAQTCTVTGGTGMVVGTNVSSVVVSCATNTYALSGTIKGLTGTGLVLQDNGGDSVSVTSSMSAFTFPTPLASGAVYAIAVSTQPTSPSQTCAVTTDANGMIGGAAVTDIAVNCTTNTFQVGGVVVGLAGTGLVLQDDGADTLQVSANGPFTFAQPVASGAMFDATVQLQPSMPSQTCVVTGASGTVVGSAVGTVTINCSTDEYTVAGTVSGLSGSGLALSLNGAAGVLVGMNGDFSFPATLLNGAQYAVTIVGQPASPSQTCTLTGATGTIAAANVSDVAVSCATNTYPINVTVTGVAGSGLTLQDSGGDNLSVPSSGSYAFATPVPSGSPYAVTVSAQPSQSAQTCVVSNGSGTVAGASVGNVTVSCSTNTYGVGGTVTGLTGTLVIQDNASDTLVVTPATGSTAPVTFTFAAPVASGGTYAVTVFQQPGSPSQTCTVSSGAGTIGAAPITSVTIACTTNTYGVSATVFGLVGTGLVVTDDAGDSVPVTQDGIVPFPTPYASGTSYTISVGTQPAGPTQTCTVSGGTGVVGAANITSVAINCTTNKYTVGGTVSGLAGTLVLQDNGADNLSLTANGTFAFATPIASDVPYVVTVLTEPSMPAQICVIANGTGTVTNANVTTVTVTCTTNKYTIGGTVSGLAGAGLVLQDNGASNLTISGNGTFGFATPIAYGTTYTVTVLTNPVSPYQTCIVTNGSGTVGNANVTNVTVTCTTNTYTIGGTLSGLAAGDFVALQDDGAANLNLAANGVFTFTPSIPSNGVYTVTVLTNPAIPSQNCVVTAGGGTVTNANITSVVVTCTTDACPAETTSSCVLTQTNSGGTDTGTCAAGSTGACSYSCSLGAWTKVTNTCAAQCPASTVNNCALTITNSGSTNTETCAAGYTGACSFSCNSGTWTQVTNTCAAQCPASTVNNCALTITNSGSTDTGTCAAGYTGACSFSCNSGTWTQITDNTCAMPTGCEAVNGILWCRDTVTDRSCDTLCTALGYGNPTITAAAWLAAQDTQALCTQIGTAFGLTFNSLSDYQYSCAEANAGQIYCSDLAACPANHLTVADAEYTSICPCR